MTKKSKLDQPIEYPPIDESETDSCRALWIGSAVQAVIDARSNPRTPTQKLDKESAIRWLQAEKGARSDFAYVCSLAGLDFEKTRTRLLELALDESQSVDFRCLKKTLLNNRNTELRSNYLSRMKRRESYKEGKAEEQQPETIAGD